MRIARRINNTYQKVYRNRHAIALNLGLKDKAFRLWDLCIALYDWDKNHEETYKTLTATDRELSTLMDCSHTSVNRARRQLLEKGLLERVGRSTYKVILPEEIAEKNQFVAEVQVDGVQKHHKSAPPHQNRGYKYESPLVSYKDSNSLKDDKEYREKWEEMGKPEDFTIEDMKFIDESLDV